MKHQDNLDGLPVTLCGSMMINGLPVSGPEIYFPCVRTSLALNHGRLGNHGNPPFLGRNNGGVTCPVRWQSTASILSKGSMQRGPLRPSKSMLSLRKSRIGDSPGDLRSFLDHLGSSQSASGYSYSTIMYNST